MDGIETFNTRNYSPGGNELAARVANQFKKCTVAGSDAHNAFEIGSAWIDLDINTTKVDDLANIFKNGKIKTVNVQHFVLKSRIIYPLQRITNATWNKAHSALNSSLPGFKKWQICIGHLQN